MKRFVFHALLKTNLNLEYSIFYIISLYIPPHRSACYLLFDEISLPMQS